MRVFAKSILNRQQILARRQLNVDGLETYFKATDIIQPDCRDLLKLCSDNFAQVNLEVGDKLYERKPFDLLDIESQGHIETALSHLSSLPNGNLLVVHLAAGCQVISPPYKEFFPAKKEDVLSLGLEYINSLDPYNELIALENIFPSDWMDEDEKIVSFYPCGKISNDFQNRIRVFDIAHYGITLLTFANLNSQGYLVTALGNMPVYFGEEEIKELEKTNNPTAATGREINQGKVIEIHVNTNKDFLDGFGVEADTYIDLEEVLKGLKREFILVPEMRESPGCDYVNTPKQKDMINYLRSLFSA